MESYYKIIVSYVGTNYLGWQAQDIGKTISQTMQKSFEKTFNVPCHLLGASRTDAGVHASYQVVSCHSTINLDSKQLLIAWNNALPLDIMIQQLNKVENRFNPFHNVLFKTYKYTIYRKRPHPQHAPFGWYYSYPINIETLKNALALFIGTHNFLALSSAEPEVDTVRTIDCITTIADEEKITITITGKSFIRHMIRRIVGAAVIVAAHKAKSIEMIATLLSFPSNPYCFETAPAHGLSLEHIQYSKEVS